MEGTTLAIRPVEMFRRIDLRSAYRRAVALGGSRPARWATLAASTSACSSVGEVAEGAGKVALGLAAYYAATLVIDAIPRLASLLRRSEPVSVDPEVGEPLHITEIDDAADLTQFDHRDAVAIGGETLPLHEAQKRLTLGGGTQAERADIVRRTRLLQVAEDETSLLEQVRQGGRLLFTRNISLAELQDIADSGALRPNGGRRKWFRYGLSHEYGGDEGNILTVVMKADFVDREAQEPGNKLIDPLAGRDCQVPLF